MFEKVLVPTDFSDEADRVLSYLKGFKRFGLKRVTLVHVADLPDSISYPLPASISNAAIARLEERRAGLEEAGLAATARLLEGTPAEEVLRVLEEDRYSLIITGTHGKRLMEEMLLGSVSESVSRQSRVPVLIMRFDALKDAQTKKPLDQLAAGTFQNVLLPTDFTGPSHDAVKAAKHLKKYGASEIVLLHVIDPKRMETENEKRERIEACLSICEETTLEFKGAELQVRAICREGDTLGEILKVADEMDASLIVMGTHGKGVVKEWLSGSISLDVVRASRRPALLVHEKMVG